VIDGSGRPPIGACAIRVWPKAASLLPGKQLLIAARRDLDVGI